MAEDACLDRCFVAVCTAHILITATFQTMDKLLVGTGCLGDPQGGKITGRDRSRHRRALPAHPVGRKWNSALKKPSRQERGSNGSRWSKTYFQPLPSWDLALCRQGPAKPTQQGGEGRMVSQHVHTAPHPSCLPDCVC